MLLKSELIVDRIWVSYLWVQFRLISSFSVGGPLWTEVLRIVCIRAHVPSLTYFSILLKLRLCCISEFIRGILWVMRFFLVLPITNLFTLQYAFCILTKSIKPFFLRLCWLKSQKNEKLTSVLQLHTVSGLFFLQSKGWLLNINSSEFSRLMFSTKDISWLY